MTHCMLLPTLAQRSCGFIMPDSGQSPQRLLCPLQSLLEKGGGTCEEGGRRLRGLGSRVDVLFVLKAQMFSAYLGRGWGNKTSQRTFSGTHIKNKITYEMHSGEAYGFLWDVEGILSEP